MSVSTCSRSSNLDGRPAPELLGSETESSRVTPPGPGQHPENMSSNPAQDSPPISPPIDLESQPIIQKYMQMLERIQKDKDKGNSAAQSRQVEELRLQQDRPASSAIPQVNTSAQGVTALNHSSKSSAKKKKKKHSSGSKANESNGKSKKTRSRRDQAESESVPPKKKRKGLPETNSKTGTGKTATASGGGTKSILLTTCRSHADFTVAAYKKRLAERKMAKGRRNDDPNTASQAANTLSAIPTLGLEDSILRNLKSERPSTSQAKKKSSENATGDPTQTLVVIKRSTSPVPVPEVEQMYTSTSDANLTTSEVTTDPLNTSEISTALSLDESSDHSLEIRFRQDIFEKNETDNPTPPAPSAASGAIDLRQKTTLRDKKELDRLSSLRANALSRINASVSELKACFSSGQSETRTNDTTEDETEKLKAQLRSVMKTARDLHEAVNILDVEREVGVPPSPKPPLILTYGQACDYFALLMRVREFFPTISPKSKMALLSMQNRLARILVTFHFQNLDQLMLNYSKSVIDSTRGAYNSACDVLRKVKASDLDKESAMWDHEHNGIQKFRYDVEAFAKRTVTKKNESTACPSQPAAAPVATRRVSHPTPIYSSPDTLNNTTVETLSRQEYEHALSMSTNTNHIPIQPAAALPVTRRVSQPEPTLSAPSTKIANSTVTLQEYLSMSTNTNSTNPLPHPPYDLSLSTNRIINQIAMQRNAILSQNHNAVGSTLTVPGRTQSSMSSMNLHTFQGRFNVTPEYVQNRNNSTQPPSASGRSQSSNIPCMSSSQMQAAVSFNQNGTLGLIENRNVAPTQPMSGYTQPNNTTYMFIPQSQAGYHYNKNVPPEFAQNRNTRVAVAPQTPSSRTLSNITHTSSSGVQAGLNLNQNVTPAIQNRSAPVSNEIPCGRTQSNSATYINSSQMHALSTINQNFSSSPGFIQNHNTNVGLTQVPSGRAQFNNTTYQTTAQMHAGGLFNPNPESIQNRNAHVSTQIQTGRTQSSCIPYMSSSQVQAGATFNVTPESFQNRSSAIDSAQTTSGRTLSNNNSNMSLSQGLNGVTFNPNVTHGRASHSRAEATSGMPSISAPSPLPITPTILKNSKRGKVPKFYGVPAQNPSPSSSSPGPNQPQPPITNRQENRMSNTGNEPNHPWTSSYSNF